MNAIVVNFKNSVPTPTTSEYFRVFYGYFLQNLNFWQDEYDKVYVLDSGWYFDSGERAALDKATSGKGLILETDKHTPYMTAFKNSLSFIKEDKVLFIHDDTVIHKKGFVKSIFENLDRYDIVSAFERIGTLIDRVNEKWPVLDGYSSFASALFGFKLDWTKPFETFEDEALYTYPVGTRIPELGYTTVEGDWVETLGRYTIRVLGKGAKVLQVPQDKSYLFYNVPTTVEKNANTEWHHLRAGIAVARMLTNKKYGWPKQYEEDLQPTPLMENLRKLAWFWFANQNPYFSVSDNDIFELLKDAKVDKGSWMDYLEKMKYFYSLEVSI